MYSLKCLYVHVYDAWDHLVKTADVVCLNPALHTHLVHETGDNAHHLRTSLPRFLLLKPGLCVGAVTLCYARPAQDNIDDLTKIVHDA